MTTAQDLRIDLTGARPLRDVRTPIAEGRYLLMNVTTRDALLKQLNAQKIRYTTRAGALRMPWGDVMIEILEGRYLPLGCVICADAVGNVLAVYDVKR